MKRLLMILALVGMLTLGTAVPVFAGSIEDNQVDANKVEAACDAVQSPHTGGGQINLDKILCSE